MTGTDERRNSRSCSGTPTRGDEPIPQPDFVGQAGFGRGFMPPPAQAGLSSQNFERVSLSHMFQPCMTEKAKGN